MFRFESPQYLYFLIAVAVVLLLYIMVSFSRRKLWKRLGDRELLRELMPARSLWRVKTKFVLCMLALVSLCVMVARPQMGLKLSEETRQGIEVMVVMDVSNSMLARDVSPNRLSRAKDVVRNVSNRLTDDKIGLVVFAGDAFIQMPITADGTSVGMFLDAISTNMIGRQGTDLGTALRLATGGFTHQENVSRAIVVITDGEDHEGGVDEAVKEAVKEGVKVYVLGIGSEEGAPIPASGGYMKDNSGQTVVTSLNSGMCREIAEQGEGSYIHVDGSNAAVDQLLYELSQLQKQKLGTASYSEYAEWFRLFAWIALILLVLDILLLESSNPRWRRFNLFGHRKAVATAGVLLALASPSAVGAQSVETQLMRKANAQYNSENYSEAEVNYRKVIEKDPDNTRAIYNLGNALLRQGKPKDAMVEYEKAVQIERNPFFKAAIYHNMGVILQSQKQFAPAIECYKNSLREDPVDDRTRYNLALCQYQLKNQPQQDQQQNQQDNKQDEQEQEQQQSQQNQDQQQEEQKQEEGGMSKENAERLLKAAQMEEKETQDKVRKAMQQRARRSNDKNW